MSAHTIPEADTRAEPLAMLWALSQVPDLGARTLVPLIRKAGSVRALWEADAAWLQEQLPPDKAQALLMLRDQPLPAVPSVYEDRGIHILPLEGDERYPALLKECYDPPLLLFVQGNPDALAGKTLAVVGTRTATDYGYKVTEALVADWQGSGVCVVSGLAAGIDGCAHAAAIRHGLPTVAVFGCGLDTIFPAQHKPLANDIIASGGALVSEYPFGIRGSKFTFPQRNRIVAGMSHGVVVVEGSYKSGALITARLALEEGRAVFAVPGNIFSPGSQGPHALIRNGAMPVVRGQDVLNGFQWLGTPETAPAQLALPVSETFSDAERQVLSSISFDPMPLETLQQKTALPAGELNEVLTSLELEGAIVSLPGAKVCRT